MEGSDIHRYIPKGPQEVSSQHTLSTTLKTHLYMDANGLGIALIQNGPYLQIINVIEKGPAGRNGWLKPGDILIKIAYANVLGCTLREVRQILQNIPVGTALQIMVYRDLVDIPQEWEKAVHLLPDLQSPQAQPGTTLIKEKEREDGWTSSEEEEDDSGWDTKFRYCMAAKSFWYDSSTELPPISKYWHSIKKNIRVLTVGPDIGCDVMFHRPFETDQRFHGRVLGRQGVSSYSPSNIAESSSHTFEPYWTMMDDVTALSSSSSSSPSSSSTSSVTDVFWLVECAFPLK